MSKRGSDAGNGIVCSVTRRNALAVGTIPTRRTTTAAPQRLLASKELIR